MPNGFTYESPLNRLLSVTLPRFIEGQLQRQQRQREFDEQMAFRESQLESQEEFRDRQLDLQEREFQSQEFFRRAKMQRDADNRAEDKLIAQKQFDRAEKIQNENILIRGVSEFGSIDDQIQALSSYKDSGQITSTQGLNLLTTELGRLRGIQSKNNTLIKL